MTSTYTGAPNVYEDPRTGEQIRIRASNMPNRYNDDVYDRRPASAHPPYDNRAGGAQSDLTRRNLRDHDGYDGYDSPRRTTREAYDDRPPRRSRRRSSSRSTNSSPPRYRSSNRRNDRKDRRARSLSANGRDKERKSGDFFDRHFDTSLNGAVAAAAGAGLGAIAARKFSGANPHRSEEDHTWRTVGGSVAGAALGNAAEKRYNRWREDEKDGRDDKRR